MKIEVKSDVRDLEVKGSSPQEVLLLEGAQACSINAGLIRRLCSESYDTKESAPFRITAQAALVSSADNAEYQ